MAEACTRTGCSRRSHISSDFTVEITCRLLKMQWGADCGKIRNFQYISNNFFCLLAYYRLLRFWICCFMYLPSAGLFHCKVHSSYSAVCMLLLLLLFNSPAVGATRNTSSNLHLHFSLANSHLSAIFISVKDNVESHENS